MTATATIVSAVASRGSQYSFCSSVPPFTSALVRISGRVISEPPMPRLARLSSSVAITIARNSPSPPSLKPPYSAGTDRPKAADLGEPGDDVLGDVAVRPVHVLGLRGDDVGGEGAERVLHELHVGVEVPWPGRLGEPGEELGVAVRREERVGAVERVRLDAPQRLAPGESRDQVVHRVGDERAGDAGLGVALAAVVEQRPRRRRRRAGVGEVVGEHLLGVGSTELGEAPNGSGDDAVGQGDDVGRGGQVRSGGVHGATIPRGFRRPAIASYPLASCPD